MGFSGNITTGYTPSKELWSYEKTRLTPWLLSHSPLVSQWKFWGKYPPKDWPESEKFLNCLSSNLCDPKHTTGRRLVLIGAGSFWQRQRLTLLSTGYINTNYRYIEYVADEATLADKTANCPHTRRSESAVKFSSVSSKPQHPGSNPILPILNWMEALGIRHKLPNLFISHLCSF